MRLNDESVMECRHLTPEERIVLQAEEIKQLWQENEQLKAKLDVWKYVAKCHMDEVIAREKQIEQLMAQVATLKNIKEMLHECMAVCMMPDKVERVVNDALAAIDKAIGGKEDE